MIHIFVLNAKIIFATNVSKNGSKKIKIAPLDATILNILSIGS
jgi:hypothetical protein